MTLPFKFNADGLVLVTVQDADTNEEAYGLMLTTSRTHFRLHFLFSLRHRTWLLHAKHLTCHLRSMSSYPCSYSSRRGPRMGRDIIILAYGDG
jgi:hypothetical protein